MKQISTLLATYRATLRANYQWSGSKDYLLDTLLQDYGHLKISDVTPDRLISIAMNSGRSASTVRLQMTTLSGVMRTGAMLWKVSNKNAPAKARKKMDVMGLTKPIHSRTRRVSSQELDAIEAHWIGLIPETVPRVLRNTCLRVAELCGALVDDFNPHAGTLIIRKRKGWKAGHPPVILPLFPETVNIISSWRFFDERLLPFSASAVSNRFRETVRAAGLEDLRLHDLRHEGISRLFEQGWTAPEVAAVSDHKNWATLQRYTHITASALIERHGINAKETGANSQGKRAQRTYLQ